MFVLNKNLESATNIYIICLLASLAFIFSVESGMMYLVKGTIVNKLQVMW